MNNDPLSKPVITSKLKRKNKKQHQAINFQNLHALHVKKTKSCLTHGKQTATCDTVDMNDTSTNEVLVNLKNATHEDKVRLELGPNTFNTWQVDTSYNFNLPDCIDHIVTNRLEQLNCKNVVVKYDPVIDNYYDGYNSDDTGLSYSSDDCNMYHESQNIPVRPKNYSYFLKKRDLNVTQKKLG